MGAILLSTTKIPQQKTKKNLNSEEKVDQQGALEPKDYGDEIPEYSFCLMYSSLGAEEVTTHKQPQDEKRQSLLSLAKGPGKGAVEKDRKLLDSMRSVAAKHPRKRCDPTHTSTSKGTDRPWRPTFTRL